MFSDKEIQKLNERQTDELLHLLAQHKQKIIKDKRITKNEACPESKEIVVVGGNGKLGTRFVDVFRECGHRVSILDKGNWDDAHTILSNAQLVLVSVPIHVTEETIGKFTNLPEDCLLADVTSLKSGPLEKMLEVHSGAVVGLHPMFGPDVENFEDQTIVVCEGRFPEKADWLIGLLNRQKAKLHHVSAKEHDQAMAIVQVLRHFSTVAYGIHLAEEDCKLKDILAMSSPIYRLELAMVGRLFAQDPDLYTEIIFSNPANAQMMRRFIQRFDSLLRLLENNDKEEFKKAFRETRDWFGEYADKFLTESSQMLAAAHTVKSD